jgi:hypothetical protein
MPGKEGNSRFVGGSSTWLTDIRLSFDRICCIDLGRYIHTLNSRLSRGFNVSLVC